MGDRYLFGQENRRLPPKAEGEVSADYGDAAIVLAASKAHFVSHRMFVVRQMPDGPDRQYSPSPLTGRASRN